MPKAKHTKDEADDSNSEDESRPADDTQLYEISLKIGPKLYKQIVFKRPEDATYKKLQQLWCKHRSLDEVAGFVWIRISAGLADRYVVQDDEDLQTALRTTQHIIIGAQPHDKRNRDIGIGVAIYVVVHVYFNLSLLWPLCRSGYTELCLW